MADLPTVWTWSNTGPVYSATVPESLLIRLGGLPDPDDELPDLAYLPGPFLADIAAEFLSRLNTGSTSSSDIHGLLLARNPQRAL